MRWTALALGNKAPHMMMFVESKGNINDRRHDRVKLLRRQLDFQEHVEFDGQISSQAAHCF